MVVVAAVLTGLSTLVLAETRAGLDGPVSDADTDAVESEPGPVVT